MALRQATERMTLDVSRLEVQTSLAVTQGDTMRRWEIKLTDRGQPIEIGKRWTAALSGIKPDGKVIYNGCTVANGRIVYDFVSGTEIATAAGAYEITLEVRDEAGEILHAPKIWLNVLKNRNRDVASEDQFTAAQEIIKRINEAEESIDGIEQANEQQGEDIEAAQEAIRYLESKTTTVQTVSVPKSSWTNSDTVNVILDKPAPTSNALIVPANGDTRRQVAICQIEVEDERETEDGWIVSLSRGEVIPETDLEFVVYVMRGDTEREIESTALLLAPAGGEANIRIADDLTTDLGYVALSARMGKKLNEEKLPAKESLDHPGCYYRTISGVTEWVNPPMIPGEEYRTTERWQGKPVYTRLFRFGSFTLAKRVELSAGNFVIRLAGLYEKNGVYNIRSKTGYSYPLDNGGTGLEIAIDDDDDAPCTDAWIQAWYVKG